MIYLAVDPVLAMHETMLERWGGEEGGGHRGGEYEGVDAAIQAVQNSYYASVPELAAAYAVYIVQGHVFMDGNKRTGLASMLLFLELNDGSCGASNFHCKRAMIALQEQAESGMKTDALVAWLVKELKLT